jgi:hypothetical protein
LHKKGKYFHNNSGGKSFLQLIINANACKDFPRKESAAVGMGREFVMLRKKPGNSFWANFGIQVQPHTF